MNYNRGNNGTFSVAPDNSVNLIMALDRLCGLALQPIEACEMTNDEARWFFSVIRERPAWAIQTLSRYNYQKGHGIIE